MSTTVYLYCLNFPNGKKYIGISKNLVKRWAGHIWAAKNQETYPVCAAIRKYGIPQLQILCAGHKDYIAALEVVAIEHFQTRDGTFGYNVALGGDLGTPGPLSTEHRAKIGAAHRGKLLSEEHCAKISAMHLGKPLSEEHRAKLSTAHLGKSKTPEHRDKLSAAHLGKSKTPEHRAKISVANLGHSVSEEARAKMSAAKLGKSHSEETRAKISAAHLKRQTAKLVLIEDPFIFVE